MDPRGERARSTTMLTLVVSIPVALMDGPPSSRIRGEEARDLVVQHDFDFIISTYKFCACCFGSRTSS